MLHCRATHQVSPRLGKSFATSRYPLDISQASNACCSIWLPTNFVSGWESTLERDSIHKISLWPVRDLAVSHYPIIISRAGKELWNVTLATRSLPAGNASPIVPQPTNLHSFCSWQATLESCTTKQFSL